jgi:hypothetical protein
MLAEFCARLKEYEFIVFHELMGIARDKEAGKYPMVSDSHIDLAFARADKL